MMPTGSAMVAGVTGWPVKHSLSPRLHGFWLDRFGIDGIYAPFPVAPDSFHAAMDGLKRTGVRGVNVTVPHKRAALDHADILDPAARLIGAVNTLVFLPDGTTEGRNTDAPGFLANLQQHAVDVTAGPVLMFGAGGAARAAVQALLSAGAPDIRLVNRSADTARQLLDDVRDDRVSYLGNSLKTRHLSDIALVVNTTSLGMSGKGDVDLDVASLPGQTVLHDIVYTPLRTGVLSRGAAQGLKTVDGLGMLLHQAVPAFEAFFGTRPEVDDALRSYLLEVL